MTERGSFVNASIASNREAGFLISVVTYCGKETDPADTRFATTVTDASLQHAKATCPLNVSGRCGALIVGEVIGDGVDLAKVESFSVQCLKPCSNGLPEVDIHPAPASTPAVS